MMRRLPLLLAVMALTVLLAPAARAGQEVATWEFNVFGAKASLDSEDPLAKERDLGPDVDGDGTPSMGTFTRSTTLDDNGFMGFRFGYVWSKWFETEVSYDRNHTGGDYEHIVTDNSSGQVEKVEGRIGAVFTSYQFGVLYHPLGEWQTPWQPFANISGGWIDVDFHPSATLQSELDSSVAGSIFKIDFPKGDHGLFLGYGVGLKYYILQNLCVRAEFRGKTYTIMGTRRRDGEFDIGISFFVPGDI